MSCQRVLSLLSAYMDNEVSSADARTFEEHLAGCASCSRELALLQVTARMLATAPEVEPPDSLLEQIEAATIRRPSIWQRLGVPTVGTYGRWAASAAVAAAILLAILVSRPPHQTANQATDRPQPPIAVQPEVVERPTEPSVIGVIKQPVNAYPRRAHKRVVAIAAVPAGNSVARAASTRPVKKPQPLEVKAEPAVETPSAAGPPAAVESTVAASPEPEPVKEVKAAQAAPEPAKHIQPENDSLAQLRAQLAAKNKNRKLQVKADPIEGHKVSVALASIRF